MSDTDQSRPPLWVGHVAMTVTDPRAAHDWYVALGMRTVMAGDDFSITELRGGTHCSSPAPPSRATHPSTS